MYTFKLHVTKEVSTLSLFKEGKMVAEESWPESKDMGRRLFESIKSLLKKSSLKAQDVSDFAIESEMPEIYTSMRIAETVKKVYSFAVTRLG